MIWYGEQFAAANLVPDRPWWRYTGALGHFGPEPQGIVVWRTDDTSIEHVEVEDAPARFIAHTASSGVVRIERAHTDFGAALLLAVDRVDHEYPLPQPSFQVGQRWKGIHMDLLISGVWKRQVFPFPPKGLAVLVAGPGAPWAPTRSGWTPAHHERWKRGKS